MYCIGLFAIEDLGHLINIIITYSMVIAAILCTNQKTRYKSSHFETC